MTGLFEQTHQEGQRLTGDHQKLTFPGYPQGSSTLSSTIMAAMAQQLGTNLLGNPHAQQEQKKHPKMPPMFQFPVGRRLKEIATNQPHPISTYL
jgi:hypothetical protein